MSLFNTTLFKYIKIFFLCQHFLTYFLIYFDTTCFLSSLQSILASCLFNIPNLLVAVNIVFSFFTFGLVAIYILLCIFLLLFVNCFFNIAKTFFKVNTFFCFFSETPRKVVLAFVDILMVNLVSVFFDFYFKSSVYYMSFFSFYY